VRINGYKGNARLTIINSTGQILMQNNQTIIDNNSLTLTLNKQLKGIYGLKVEANNEESVQRIIVF
jgi:Secretion system C-terminal sorting domain